MVTLIKNKRGQLRTRKYNRRKPLKAQYRAMKKTAYWLFVIVLLGILAYTVTNAKAEYTTVFRDVEKERIIWVTQATPSPIPATVEQQIRSIAKEMNFKWDSYLVRLAKCESSLNPKAYNNQNNNPKTSTDRGLFMISDYWHKEISDKCAYDITCSTKFAINLINKGRQSEFICDRYIK